MSHYEKKLRQTMAQLGFGGFRSPEQEFLVRSVIEGKDALAIMPTGSGKSAGFIIPTIVNGFKTVVISPLLSLMNDQVMKLRAWGIPAFVISSESDPFDNLEAMIIMMGSKGKPAFLYASPEMLSSDGFRKKFKNFKPDLIAIDEAHCVSTWGDTFRPSYLGIPEISESFGSPQCVAFSATIDQKIEKDVVTRLPLIAGYARVAMSPFRPNLAIEVRMPGAKEKRVETRNRLARQELFKLLQETKDGAVIVYCYSRNRVAQEYEYVKEYARKLGYRPLIFHAEITPEDKKRALEVFMSDKRPLVFCTTAFGMGVDKPDVRLVVHFDPPGTLVDYAQQIGRAGRDGLPARCVTFYDPRRINEFDTKVRIGIPDAAFVERIHRRLVAYWRKAGGKITLIGFMRQAEILATGFNAPEVFTQRLERSVSILKQTGYFYEEASKIKMRRLLRGVKRYQKLLELTEMSIRRQVRETERLKRFFKNENPTQELLWQIIGE